MFFNFQCIFLLINKLKVHFYLYRYEPSDWIPVTVVENETAIVNISLKNKREGKNPVLVL